MQHAIPYGTVFNVLGIMLLALRFRSMWYAQIGSCSPMPKSYLLQGGKALSSLSLSRIVSGPWPSIIRHIFFVFRWHGISSDLLRRLLLITVAPFTTWFNLNPSMNEWSHHYKWWNEITYPFLNFNGCTVEVSGWINIVIPALTGHVITFPGWD